MPTDIIKDRIKSNQDYDDFSQKIKNVKKIWSDSPNYYLNDVSENYDLKYVSQTNGYQMDSNQIPCCDSGFSIGFKEDMNSYMNLAQNDGFIVGEELEKVKAKSRRSLMQQMSNHISKNFQSLYGKENTNNRQNYFQIGVRVPSKEHVSEIVGKQGIKIKEIRETTGALIITPGESEDHVFIIEAQPSIALKVARTISQRAREISINRQRDQLMMVNCSSTPSTSASSVSVTGGVAVSAANRMLRNSPTNGEAPTQIQLAATTASGAATTTGNCAIVSCSSATNSDLTAMASSTPGSMLPATNVVFNNKSINAAQNGLRPILASGFIEVPKSIVGRIIGTHGSIITTIQKDTGTEIRSPPKDPSPTNNSKSLNIGAVSAKFEILVYQKSPVLAGGNMNPGSSLDAEEAQHRIHYAKQLIAHVALHQMERIRAEESPFSNYRRIIKTLDDISTTEDNTSSSNGGGVVGGTVVGSGGTDTSSTSGNKEQLLTYQMQSVNWLWPDVDKLDENAAEEIVSRILEESKKKSKLRTEFNVNEANMTGGNVLDCVGSIGPSCGPAYKAPLATPSSAAQHHHTTTEYLPPMNMPSQQLPNTIYDNFNSVDSHGNKMMNNRLQRNNNYFGNYPNFNNNNSQDLYNGYHSNTNYNGYDSNSLLYPSNNNTMMPLNCMEFDSSCKISNSNNLLVGRNSLPHQQKSYADNFKMDRFSYSYSSLDQNRPGNPSNSSQSKHLYGAIGERIRMN